MVNLERLMDAFTMIVLACVSGEPQCIVTRVNETGFTSAEACEARIDEIAHAMTKEFGQKAGFKGRAVTYDVSCLNRQQLARTLGIVEADT